MVDANSSTQSEATRRFFDGRAEAWAKQYQSGGCMDDRITRFLAPLKELVPPGGRVLDLGCGTGEIAATLAGAGWRVTACDMSAAMIAAARARHQGAEVEWRVLDRPAGEGTGMEEASFDAVLCSSVLEYVADIPRHLAEIARILVRGGIFLATVPDMSHPLRHAEESRRRLTRSALLMALLRHTRWGSDFEYLRLSVNRWPLERWIEAGQAAGLTAGRILPWPAPHPLALLAFGGGNG